jgi:hypothetical protein
MRSLSGVNLQGVVDARPRMANLQSQVLDTVSLGDQVVILQHPFRAWSDVHLAIYRF